MVPRIFWRTILAACHASPFAGHCSETKTLWQVLSKYWWPSVVKDAREGVRGCAHCKAANIASHSAFQLLKSIQSKVPFDVMVFDIWKPGVMPSNGRKAAVSGDFDRS